MTRTRVATRHRAIGAVALLAGPFALAAACVSSTTTPRVGELDAASPFDAAEVDAAYSLNHCPNGGAVGGACGACLQSSCAAQAAAVDTACASALACACPLGVDALSCALDTACETALEGAAAQCASCATACGVARADGGDAAPPPTDSGTDATLPVNATADSAPPVDAADATPPIDAPGSDAPSNCPTTEAGVVETSCSGMCTDTNTDPLNCGGCSHVCTAPAPSTVACNTGRCIVTLVAPALPGDWPQEIAIHAGTVYFSTSNEDNQTEIGSVPVGGGPSPVILSHIPDKILGLAVDDNGLYYAAQSTSQILALPFDGGAPVQLAAGESCESDPTTWACTASLALLGSTLFYTATGPYTGSSVTVPGLVQSVQTNGTGGFIVATDSNNGFSIGRVVAAGSNVVWMNEEAKTLERVSPDGGAVMAIPLPDGGGVDDIAADTNNVYFVDGANVYQAPLDGGAIMTLASGQQAVAVASDGTSVYWGNSNFTDPLPGAIVKVPIGGGTPTTLVSGLQKLWSLATDGTNVYVGAYSTEGVLMQVPAN